MTWMYHLIKDERKVKLCELYMFDGFEGYVTSGYGYCPVSWFNIFRYPRMIISDLLCQKRVLNRIPYGEYLTEQITEALTYE